MNLEEVIQLHAAGEVQAAEQGYRAIIAGDAGSDLAYSNLALICLLSGRIEEGKALLQTALSINPMNAEAQLNLGIAYKETGFRDEAIKCYLKALELHPVYPQAYNNLGIMHVEGGNFEDGIACYKMAIELDAAFPQAMYNLGNVLKAQGKFDEAVAYYWKVLEEDPTFVDAYLNLANVFMGLNKMDEAITCLTKALEIRPNYPEAYLNLGSIYTALGKAPHAASNLMKAIELRPDYAEAHNNLAIALRDMSSPDDALNSYRKAIELKPDYPEAHSNLGNTLLVHNRPDEAIAAYQKSFQLRNASGQLSSLAFQLGTLLNELERFPIIYRDLSEIENYRAGYSKTLNRALDLVLTSKWANSAEDQDAVRQILFRITNFYLGYQQLNDRDLQIAYAQLATEILKPEIEPYLSVDGKSSQRSKIRLGMASELLNRHSASYWSYGWLSNLSPDDYDMFIYSLNGKSDEITRQFAALGTFRWLPFSAHNYLQSLEAIRQDELDVLLIPDVGMTASGRILSLTRLAPIQCMAFTHPLTSGSPNIDFYLSSELMETDRSDNQYSEKLVRLPNLGACLAWPEIPELTAKRADFDLPADRVIYGTVQSLFKYLPQYDCVYPAIAKKDPGALLVFMGSESTLATSDFVSRLKEVFEREGLNFEHFVRVFPRMPVTKFMQLQSLIDVVIDTIGWNGSTTTLAALSMNLPVVTLPGETMRARHCYSMLKVLGADELIATSLDDFASLAVRVGVDRQFRADVIERINRHKHKLFDDKSCVQVLDQFIKSEVGRIRQYRQSDLQSNDAERSQTVSEQPLALH